MYIRVFPNKMPSFKRLEAYGFSKDGSFRLSRDVGGGMLVLNISISVSGVTEYEVIDKETGDEYTLINNPRAQGSFVGALRAECDEIFEDIAEHCFDSNIFKFEQSKLVIKYAEEKYGSHPEFLWDDTPNNAIFRNIKTNKWYAALLTVEETKVGLDGEGVIEIINLKDTPENVAELLKGGFLPAYHMNKKHWYTIPLNGSIDIERVFDCIDSSYELIDRKNHLNKES